MNRSSRTRPRRLDEINSPGDEFSPVISSDGRTILWTGWRTNSHDGGSEFEASDVWMATRTGPFDPMIHDEPPRFGSVRKVPVDLPDTHFYDIAISHEWPNDGAPVYFVSCVPELCSQRGQVFDIYSATWHSADGVVDCDENGVIDSDQPDCDADGVRRRLRTDLRGGRLQWERRARHLRPRSGNECRRSWERCSRRM